MSETENPMIREIVDTIVLEVDPETVILFGSHARVDFLPVLNDEDS